jgi:tripartite-type tricarboxylate transporter receptor subunit TctC
MNRIGFVALSCLLATPLHAEEEFFKGKTITIVNSTGNGGSYYNVAMAMTRHMPKYIPGRPAMVVQSMPGGGNVLATNFMYTNAPKDGTYIATINNSIPLHQVLDGRGVRYDADKFHWLGSTGTYNSVAYVWHTSNVMTYKDLFTKTVILGGTGVGSSIVIYPTITNAMLGTKFDIVLGYKTTADIDLAMERGEVQARTGSYTGLVSDHPDWIRDKKVRILFQIGSKPDPALKDVALMTDLARSDEDKQIMKLVSSPIDVGRPYLTPPGVPEDRVEILRQAFQQTLRDKEFLAEMAQMGHDIDPVSAEELTQIVHETVSASPELIAKAKTYINSLEHRSKDK